MVTENWLAITSVGLFAMFSGEMFSVYYFMVNVNDDSGFFNDFSADPKILQFISIGVAPAGILSGVSYLMSKQYGSRLIGMLIIVGGIVMLVGMIACYSLLNQINNVYITDAVRYTPILFMILSAPTIGVGAYLVKHKKMRPKKEFF